MDLVGYVGMLGVQYPLVYTSFNKTSRMWLLVTPNVKYMSLLHGDKLKASDVIEMLDIGQQLKIGSPVRLERILQEISNFKVKCILNYTPEVIGSVAQYKDDKRNIIHLQGRDYVYLNLKLSNGTIIVLEQAHNFQIEKKSVRQRAEKILIDQTKTSISQFLDSTMESLELRGYNFDWLANKKYIPIHTMDEYRTIFLPHLKRCLDEQIALGEKLIVTLDFESTGLEAYDEKCSNRDVATFLGISFEDHTAYGLFLDMENFENLPSSEIAKELTHFFSADLIEDRDIELLGAKYKRSDFFTTSHNMMIDIRFGLTVNMDIWFNFCSMQAGFNLDPFLTKGHNGAKDRVTQFFGIEYPELGETAGKGFYGYFNRFSDKRVIMMYGCADVDLVRMFTRIMLEEIPKLEKYYTVNHLTQFKLLDEPYMNMKARFDYLGIRVDKDKARERAGIVSSKIKTLTDFLASYVPRAEMAVRYVDLFKKAQEVGRDITQIAPPRLDTIPPMEVEKWSGDFLINVLFKRVGYKILFTTNSDDIKKRKPRLDKDAIADYLLHKVDITYPDKITSLEEYCIKAKYLERDIYYDVTDEKGNPLVAIEAKKFNSYQYPLFYVLSILGPLEKEMSSDLAPLLVNDSDYRFVDTRTTTIVTRRDVSPLSTIKATNKDLYVAYDPNEYYILDADQAAVEIRIAAGLSEDESIIAPLRNPETDPHVETAAKMLRKPAFLIDKVKERKPIKFINFGRIYKRGAHSICKQIFGQVTPELKAMTERLLALFDIEKAAIHRELDKYRTRSVEPQEIPTWLKWFLKMDETKSYGKMDNTFGFIQHIDLSREESWWIPSMQRKSGNFAVQGLAANLLRVLYNRFVKECWKRGWIQDHRLIIHTTIYDEILVSFHKSIDLFELLSVLRSTFVVKYRKFPPLFVGANVAHSWGDTKDDNYEIPSVLLETYQKQYQEGTAPKIPPGTDYVDWILNDIVRYKKERTCQELEALGFDKKKVLHFEQFSERFTSYYVRTLLLDFKGFMFKIGDYSDPVEVLASTLLHFISQNLLDDGEVLRVNLRGQRFGITNKAWRIGFASEDDFIHGRKPTDTNAPSQAQSLDVNDESNDDDDDVFYSFNDTEEDSYIDGSMHLTNWVIPSEYDPASLKLAQPDNTVTYKHFAVRDGHTLIRLSAQKQVLMLKNFLLRKATTSMDSVKVYYKYMGTVHTLGNFKSDVLQALDSKEELWI